MKNLNLLILTLLFGSYGSILSMQSSGSSIEAGRYIFSAVENGNLDWLKINLSNINRLYPDAIYQKFVTREGSFVTSYALAVFKAINYFNALNWDLYNKYIEIAKLLVSEDADFYGDNQAELYLSQNSSIKNAINSVSRKRSRENHTIQPRKTKIDSTGRGIIPIY